MLKDIKFFRFVILLGVTVSVIYASDNFDQDDSEVIEILKDSNDNFDQDDAEVIEILKDSKNVLEDEDVYEDAIESLDYKNQQAQILLHQSIKNKNLSLILQALSEGADINVENEQGLTPLQVAINTYNIPVIDFIISLGADLKYIDKQGRSIQDFMRQFKIPLSLQGHIIKLKNKLADQEV